MSEDDSPHGGSAANDPNNVSFKKKIVQKILSVQKFDVKCIYNQNKFMN